MDDIYFPGMKQSDNLATATAIQAGADPQALAKAKKELGKEEYIGYCESFVRQMTDGKFRGGSASEAWKNQQDTAVQGLEGVQPGDKVYFNNPSNPDGHVGIFSGNNRFISATDKGIQDNDINDWITKTNQSVLGYIPQPSQTPDIYFPGMMGVSNTPEFKGGNN